MTPKRILFRCDAGGDHGLGHLMRCLSLADALRDHGLPVAEFIMQASDDLQDRVMKRGFVACHATSVAGTDADAMIHMLEAETGPVWLVIDGKYVQPDYVEALKGQAKIICFDDELLRDFPAQIIINSQPWTRPDDYSARPGRTVLAGAVYNAVAPAYFDAARHTDRKSVLITLGGEDPANDTAWIARELGDLLAKYPVEVVLGPAHPDPEAARQAVRQAWPGARIVEAPPDLVDNIHRAWLAISAGGTTCYELQAAGVATLAIAVEPHQIPFVAALEDLGGVVSLGGPQPRDASAARVAVARMLGDSRWRQLRIDRGRQLFPGPGGAALVPAIMAALGGGR